MKNSETASKGLTAEELDRLDDEWCTKQAEKMVLPIAKKAYHKLQKEMRKVLKLKTEDEWIKLTEAARLVGVDKGTISRWASENLIEDNAEIGRKRKILLSSILLIKYIREKKNRQRLRSR